MILLVLLRKAGENRITTKAFTNKEDGECYVVISSVTEHRDDRLHDDIGHIECAAKPDDWVTDIDQTLDGMWIELITRHLDRHSQANISH